MRITAVTSYNNNINRINKNNKSTQKREMTTLKQYNNSPAFGKFILDNIYNWSMRKMNESMKYQAMQQIQETRKQVLDDVELLAKRQGVSREAIESQYGKYIQRGGIKPKYNGEEVGLNKIVGYSQEKLELLKKVVVPIINLSEAKKTGKKISQDINVPSGIIMYGREGSGKYFTAQALLDHIDHKAKSNDLPIKTMTVSGEWWKGDTQENIETIQKAFKEARKNSANNEHTIIFIDNMDELLTSKNNTQLKDELIKQTQHPKKDGITWIGTVDDINHLSRPFFRRARTSLFAEIDKTRSEAESLALYKYFVSQTGRESRFDEKYILDYTRNSKIPCTPKKIKQIVKFANDELKMTQDYNSPKKGVYIAPLDNMQLMMGVDYVAKYNYNKVVKPFEKQDTYIPKNLFIDSSSPIHENNGK